jgi:hypothetical protein
MIDDFRLLIFDVSLSKSRALQAHFNNQKSTFNNHQSNPAEISDPKT